MKQFETVTFKGTAVHTNGMMPQKGEMAPDFTAVAGDLSELSLGSLKGKRVILNIFPSLDTSVCIGHRTKRISLDGHQLG